MFAGSLYTSQVPDSSFGVSPILEFRSLSGHSELSTQTRHSATQCTWSLGHAVHAVHAVHAGLIATRCMRCMRG